MNWDALDFGAAAVLLGGAGAGFWLVSRRASSGLYRVGLAIAVLTGLALVWVSLAVGIIGSEGHSANLMYAGLLALGAVSALLVRFSANGLALTLLAMTVGQLAIGAVAFIGRMGTTGTGWPWDVAGASALFAILWLIAAWLFHTDARRTV